MIENLITSPPAARIRLCFLDGRHDGSAGLICLQYVLLVPDRHNAVEGLCRELSQLAWPCVLRPCRVVRMTGKAAPEDFVKLLRGLAAGNHSLRRYVITRNGDYLIDVEVAESR
jgi:hypothetical protein